MATKLPFQVECRTPNCGWFEPIAAFNHPRVASDYMKQCTGVNVTCEYRLYDRNKRKVVELPADDFTEAKAFAALGLIIKAIKAARAVRNLSLIEAKDLVLSWPEWKNSAPHRG